MAARYTEYQLLDDVQAALVNPKRHAGEVIEASIGRHGYIESPTLDERTGRMVGGHGRVAALVALRDRGEPAPDGIDVDDQGRWLVPIGRGWASPNDLEAAAALVTLNRTTELGGWDLPQLGAVLAPVAGGPGLDGVGYTLDEVAVMLADPAPELLADPAASARTLAERFLVPPFSVLDARQGYWQDRKRAWLALGIRSEVGRPHNVLTGRERDEEGRPLGAANRSVPDNHSGNDPAYYWKKQEAEKTAGRELTNAEFEAEFYEAEAYVGGTSIFDPVLCEIAYRWFCPPTGSVLDPFAGGSVRGVVAAWLGRRYTGIELRAEQVEANQQQALDLLGDRPGTAEWILGDAAALGETIQPDTADLLFSCPPYFDLEVYSDEPGDLSNAPGYGAFLTAYSDIIGRAASCLADDRFAVWVVGEIRDKHGAIRNLVPDTIRAFEAAGLTLQSDAVLVTAVGSLALRAARIFGGARRLARGHQYVLIFCKGDPGKATAACGPVDIGDPAEMFGELLTPAAD